MKTHFSLGINSDKVYGPVFRISRPTKLFEINAIKPDRTFGPGVSFLC